MIQNKQETGRSMVEMLGVLGIIGVLSVSGIAGYTYAMNKHRANEIISSVSKMAMTATTEIDLRGSPSLVEFKKGGTIYTDNGYAVVLDDDPNNGIFRLKVQNVPESVCDHIQNLGLKIAFNISACASGDNEVVFSFYDSLDTAADDDTPLNGGDSGTGGESSSPSSGAVSSATQTVSTATQTATTTPLSSAGNEEPTPSGGEDDEPNASGCPGDSQAEAIVGGTSFTVTSGSDTLTCYCPAGQSFQGKKCQNVPTTSCTSSTENECGLGYFCLFSNPSGCYDSTQGIGICTKIEGDYAGYQNTGGYWYEKTQVNWYTANSWCVGMGRSGLMTCDADGSGYSCTAEDVAGKWEGTDVLGIIKVAWLKNLTAQNSCDAFTVNLTNGAVYGFTRTSTFSALCR